MTESIIGLSPAPTASVFNMKQFVLQGGLFDTSSVFRNRFTGKPEVLLAHGLINPQELKPQVGRVGRAEFNADGTDCPAGSPKGGWRIPGHRCITLLDDAMVRLEVTLTKEEMKERRKQQAWAAEQKEIEASGIAAVKLRTAPLEHTYESNFESWVGTKDQLQAIGLGANLDFPLEGNGRSEIRCKCPLGFDVSIHNHHSAPERLAGRYRAISRYIEDGYSRPHEVVEVASGVVQLVSSWRDVSSDTFQGAADDLIAAGFARPGQFPGEPGRNKGQCTYRLDGTIQGTSNYNRSIMIKANGNGRFIVERYVSEEEQRRRSDIRSESQKHEDTLRLAKRNERMRVRGTSVKLELGPAGIEEFRAKQKANTEMHLRMLYQSAFGTSDHSLYSLGLTLTEGDEAYDEIAQAFESIRNVVNNAPVQHNKKAMAALTQRRMFATAQRDLPLQNFLRRIESDPAAPTGSAI